MAEFGIVGPIRWHVKRVLVQTQSDEEYLNKCLRDDWEPFACTSDNGLITYHLRIRDND